MQRGLPFDERSYQIITDSQKLYQILLDYVDEYNLMNQSSQLSLVLFQQFIDKICNICRILRPQRSHGIIVGVSGCGKSTVTKLSGFISQCKISTPKSKA